jgi:hypothetical protein
MEFRDSIGNCLDGSSTEQAEEGKFEHDERIDLKERDKRM